MKVYQLCFPDGDGYPVVPRITYANTPTLEDLNKFFKELFNEYKNVKRRNGESVRLIQITNKEYQKLVFGEGLQLNEVHDYSYGNDIVLEEIEVIENIPTMG